MSMCPACQEEGLEDDELEKSSLEEPVQCSYCFRYFTRLRFFEYLVKGVACYNFLLALFLLGIGYWGYALAFILTAIAGLVVGKRFDDKFFSVYVLESAKGVNRKQKALISVAVFINIAIFVFEVNILPAEPLINLLFGPFILSNYL